MHCKQHTPIANLPAKLGVQPRRNPLFNSPLTTPFGHYCVLESKGTFAKEVMWHVV